MCHYSLRGITLQIFFIIDLVFSPPSSQAHTFWDEGESIILLFRMAKTFYHYKNILKRKKNIF